MVRIPNNKFTEIITIRITCGRVLFEFYVDLLKSLLMQIIIRIRVDTP